jgi:hypothetical protein
MTENNKPFRPSRRWLQAMGDLEDSCPTISVGGLASDCDMLPAGSPDAGKVFGRLIEFTRRK